MAKMPKPEEMIASRASFPEKSWMDVKTEIKAGMYAYPAKVDIMEGLHMPHPHAWQPEEEDWHLPENWEEIIYKALKERLAHPVACAMSPRLRNIGRTSFALFMSTSAPRKACTGSMITSLALFSRIALAMRSSARVSGVSLSSMTSTFSRSASASISRGLTVSPRPSSAVW